MRDGTQITRSVRQIPENDGWLEGCFAGIWNGDWRALDSLEPRFPCTLACRGKCLTWVIGK